MNTKNLVKLIVWLAICQLPGLMGMSFVYGNMEWYNRLAHPPFTPPGALFGIVWGVLYLLLGVSAFFAFREKLHGKALMLLMGQLALNACWTPLFFGAHCLAGGVILIVAMIGEFYFLFKALRKINRFCANLLLPYGAWLVFAAYLTAATWWLN